jgi:hypothetical protein
MSLIRCVPAAAWPWWMPLSSSVTVPPAHPDDRLCLSLFHPVTKEICEHLGLPMGAVNLPALAGGHGLAFVPMMKTWFQEFQGKPWANCWWTGFLETGEHDPDEGYGCVLPDESGSPVVRIWVHADDFLVHGDTCERTAWALKLFWTRPWMLVCCATLRRSRHRRKS